MKYQFTTEGSKPQTKYHHIQISDAEGIVYQTVVSTPLPAYLLQEYLRDLMEKRGYDLCVTVGETYLTMEQAKANVGFLIISPIGLDSIARIISNIKPLKQKVVISICGEKKVYELDADKLETLLKSLE